MNAYAVPWLGDVGEWAEWYLAVYRDLFLPILHRACPRDGMARFLATTTDRKESEPVCP